jgi:hypothetical protein
VSLCATWQAMFSSSFESSWHSFSKFLSDLAMLFEPGDLAAQPAASASFNSSSIRQR